MAPVFGSIWSVSVLVPCPAAGSAIVIHEAPEEAAHAQPAGVVTVIVREPPVVIANEPGETL